MAIFDIPRNCISVFLVLQRFGPAGVGRWWKSVLQKCRAKFTSNTNSVSSNNLYEEKPQSTVRTSSLTERKSWGPEGYCCVVYSIIPFMNKQLIITNASPAYYGQMHRSCFLALLTHPLSNVNWAIVVAAAPLRNCPRLRFVCPGLHQLTAQSFCYENANISSLRGLVNANTKP